jgi:hypothetical protein
MVISQYHNLIYSSSTQFNADSKEKLFDNNFTNNGLWQLSQYFSGGTYITNSNRYINVDYKGDWLVIKLPNPIVLKGLDFIQNQKMQLELLMVGNFMVLMMGLLLLK